MHFHFLSISRMPVFVLYVEKITQHICELPTGGKRTDVHRQYQTPKTFRNARRAEQ